MDQLIAVDIFWFYPLTSYPTGRRERQFVGAGTAMDYQHQRIAGSMSWLVSGADGSTATHRCHSASLPSFAAPHNGHRRRQSK